MTKRILLILLMSLLVNCSIHSQTTISGIVISIENNQPVSGANITVNGFTTGCTSDQSGKFSITGSFPSKIKIRISHLGFDTKEKTISTDNNKAVELQIILTPVNYLLEEVTVKASSGRGTDLTVPQKVDIIDRGKIMLHPSTQIDQALEYIGGVNVERDFGIYSDKVSVSLRGAGSGQSRTLVVLDGIPLNKTDGGGVNWNMINKDLVRDIRVIKGPGNAKYGSNAMGGVIEISTGIPEKPIAGKIRLRGGTYRTAGYDTHLEGLITNTRDSQYFWNFNHNVTRSDGYINIPDELITAADTFIVPSFLREYSAEFQAGYKAKKSIATVSFSFYDDKRGKGFKAFEDDGGYSEHDTYSSIARYKANAGKTRIFCFVYTIHENYRRMNEYMQDGEYKLYEVDSKRDDRGAKCYAERMFAGHLFTAGMEYKHGAVDGSDIYYTSTDLIRNKGMMDIFSVYIQDDFKLLSEKIDINLGIRQDYAVFHHGLYTIEDPSYSIEYLVDYQQESIPA
ncbi:MAG: TonB-dependent receptor plug domain-containing protein, partial [Bacteroidota bacterium]